MNEDEPRELSLAEVDDLSMRAIDQITARHPVREYRTLKADGGMSSHVLEFHHGHCVAWVGVAGAPAPTPSGGQAMRTDSGRPRSSMRLRAWTPTLTSVTRRRLVRECSPSPITRLNRPTVASARARAL